MLQNEVVCCRLSVSVILLVQMVVKYLHDTGLERLEAPWLVLDIHNTSLVDGIVNLDVLPHIDRAIAQRRCVLFLSYDGNEERMTKNAGLLNTQCPKLTAIPKVCLCCYSCALVSIALREV